MSWFKCPWCGVEHDAMRLFGLDNGRFNVRCKSCDKPIVVDIEVEVTAEARKDESEIANERELYEKRMRGDWS